MTKVTLFLKGIGKSDRQTVKKLVAKKGTGKRWKAFKSCIHLVSMFFCSFAGSKFSRVNFPSNNLLFSGFSFQQGFARYGRLFSSV